MVPQGGNLAVQDDVPEIVDVAENRVSIEEMAIGLGDNVYGIEDRRYVHQEHGEDVIEVSHIPEKNVDSRQEHADSDIQDDETGQGDQEENIFPGHRKPRLQEDEEEKDGQGQSEIHDGGDVFR